MNIMENEKWPFWVTLIGVICLIGVIYTNREYKPPYKDNNVSVEYMWGKLEYNIRRTIKAPGDSTIVILKKTDYVSLVRSFEIQTHIIGKEGDLIILSYTKNGWIEEGKKENSENVKKLIKLTYMYF
jgi:hypothetical protein